MPAKIAAFLITLTLNVLVGIVLLMALILAMNGYSESDAMYGLATYVILALLASVVAAAAAVFITGMLIKREFRALISTLIAIAVFTLVGAVAIAICAVVGIGVAEAVRVNL